MGEGEGKRQNLTTIIKLAWLCGPTESVSGVLVQLWETQLLENGSNFYIKMSAKLIYENCDSIFIDTKKS